MVNAPVSQVWQAVCAPESYLVQDPVHMVCAGRVPGTPSGQVGEMQYFVRREDDGRLTARALVVTELTDQRSALTVGIAPRRVEMLHLVTAREEGTHLQLTCRWPRPTSRKWKQAVMRGMTDTVEAYKTLIENTNRADSSAKGTSGDGLIGKRGH
jgi:hypothetical protein